MRFLLIVLASVLLQACATTPTVVGLSNLSKKSSTDEQAINADVHVYVSNQIQSESFMLDFANNERMTVTPGIDLITAALDVSDDFFRDAKPLNMEEPANFILKLHAESFLQVHNQAQVKGVLTAELMTMSGESIYIATISRTEKTRKIDQHAYYGVYAKAVQNFLEQAYLEKAEEINKHIVNETAAVANPIALVKNETLDLASTGTGFFVNKSGHVITNHHVVEQCVAVTIAIDGESYFSRIVNRDREKDIAVLETGLNTSVFAHFNENNSGERLGENILTLGYPLYGVLSSSINLTTGNISSMLGVKDDDNVYQITAPIQAGNSGGPVLNQKGLVAGVVQSKLNALELSRLTGDLAQNVNFAIKSSSIKDFLSSSDITYHTAAYSEHAIKTTVELADEARDYTVQIKCHG